MTHAQQSKVFYENGFVDIVLPDGSVLSLKVDEDRPELWRYESVRHHCYDMGDESFQETYFNKVSL